MTKPIVFLAPGSGMGHLMRCAAIAMVLRCYNERSVIYTCCPVLQWIADATGLDIHLFNFQAWTDPTRVHHLLQCVSSEDPKLIVADTFPYGIRGELQKHATWTQQYRWAYLARRMQWDRYVRDVKPVVPMCPPFENTILLEALRTEHMDAIKTKAYNLMYPGGPVSMPPELVYSPIAPELQEAVDNSLIVVASHTENEMNEMYRRALEDRGTSSRDIVVVSMQEPEVMPEEAHWFRYFPVSALFKSASAIYGTCSYNIVAEIVSAGLVQRYHPHHFERRYDLPIERWESYQEVGTYPNGVYRAAEFIKDIANES